MKTLKIVLFSFALIFALNPVKAQNTAVKADAENNMLTAYYGVKDALINGNAAVVSDKAKSLQATVAADKKLSSDAKLIAESEDIEKQRTYFASLSKSMFEVVKKLNGNNATVYQLYCPMKKVSWLSDSSAIQNPYYGNVMLTCGKVTDTLAPVK